MAGLLATEHEVAALELVEDVAIADRRTHELDAVRIERSLQSKVGHHGGNHCVTAQQPAVVKIDRGDGEHLIAVDQLALLVDCDHAIGVAVERQADLCPRGGHRGAELLGVRGTARVVDVRAVGCSVQHLDVGTDRAERRGRGSERGPVPTVDDDAYAVDPTALEGLGEVRDVVVERAPVLGRDPDAGPVGPGARASTRPRRRARIRRVPRAVRGSCGRPGAKSLMPLSS